MVTIWLRETLLHGAKVALIDELITDQSARGRGIGSQSVDYTIAHCARLGREEVELTAETYNTAARDYSLQWGFVKRGVLLEHDLEKR